MTKQQLKLNIELQVSDAICSKFPEADDVVVGFDPDTKELTTRGLEKYLIRYGLDFQMRTRHEFLIIIDNNMDLYKNQ